MDLPKALWTEARDAELAVQTAELFAGAPLILTDKLTNSVYLNAPAERLFGDRAESLVNRAACSLLGFGDACCSPEALTAALLGKSAPWRQIVRPVGTEAAVFCEASAITRGETLVCGIVRLSSDGA